MKHEITLYGHGTTRSARCEWTLRELDVDLLFSPDIESIYPFGLQQATQVTVPGFTDDLCGIGRPHHFDGVCSVPVTAISPVSAWMSRS